MRTARVLPLVVALALVTVAGTASVASASSSRSGGRSRPSAVASSARISGVAHPGAPRPSSVAPISHDQVEIVTPTTYQYLQGTTTTTSTGGSTELGLQMGSSYTVTLHISSGSFQPGTTYENQAGFSVVVSDGGVLCTGSGSTGSVEVDQVVDNGSGNPTSAAFQFLCETPNTLYVGAMSLDITPTTPGQGYYLSENDGNLWGGFHNDAYLCYLGNLAAQPLNAPVVGMAVTADGGGYWMATSDGGVFAYGDAKFHGSHGGTHLNAPIVGMAATPDGGGYWLAASDGGIFTYGDAHFYGSHGGSHLNAPIVGMAATADGKGYWLVASDGGIFTYGDAHFYGSTGNIKLNSPMVGMLPAPGDTGYWLVAQDGGVFAEHAPFYGSLGSYGLDDIVAMAH